MKSDLEPAWRALVCVLAVSLVASLALSAAGCAESSAPAAATAVSSAPASSEPPAPDAAPAADAASVADGGADGTADQEGEDAGAEGEGGDDLPRIRMGSLAVEPAAVLASAPATAPTGKAKKTGATRLSARSATTPRKSMPAASVATAKEVSAMGTIRAHMGEVEDCYGRVALKDPSIAGRVTVRWTLGRDGVPSAVAVVGDTLKDKSVGVCIKERARTWKFPAPAGGLGVVTYPFDLRVM